MQPFNLILKIFTQQHSERKFNTVLFYFSGFSSPSHWTVHVCSKNTYQEKMVSVNFIILCIIVAFCEGECRPLIRASKNVGVLMTGYSWLVTQQVYKWDRQGFPFCNAECNEGLRDMYF